jgi:NADH:ubiquinone oxidoreductase subunit H
LRAFSARCFPFETSLHTAPSKKARATGLYGTTVVDIEDCRFAPPYVVLMGGTSSNCRISLIGSTAFLLFSTDFSLPVGAFALAAVFATGRRNL